MSCHDRLHYAGVQKVGVPSSNPTKNLRLGACTPPAISLRLFASEDTRVIGLRYEIDEGHRSANRKSGMARLESTMPSVAPMSGSIEAAQLGKVLGDSGQIPEQKSDRLHALGFVGYALRHQTQFLRHQLGQIGQRGRLRKADLLAGQY